ncbi:MAG: hypothetical protein GXY18_04290, partial [Methanomicrobiales archaeon]|nr:hypothetical protein [Methanomicrobiales archaeon]
FESNHPGELIDIVPVIIYHGAKKWNVLAHGSNQHIKGQHFIQRYEFFDISHTPDNKLVGPPQLRLFLLLLKYARSTQIMQKIDNLFVLIKETHKKESIDPAFVYTVLRYMKYASLPGLREGVMKKIEEFLGSRDTQDIGLYIRKEDFEEGEKQGLEEGEKHGFEKGEKHGFEKGEKHGFEKGEKHGFEKTAIAIAMIKNKENDEKIMKETGLSIEEITRLRKLVEN